MRERLPRRHAKARTAPGLARSTSPRAARSWAPGASAPLDLAPDRLSKRSSRCTRGVHISGTAKRGYACDAGTCWPERVLSFVLAGHHVILVSSGAVGVGCQRLGLTTRPTQLARKQALAAVGQVHLMRFYEDFLSSLGLVRAANAAQRWLVQLQRSAKRRSAKQARAAIVCTHTHAVLRPSAADAQQPHQARPVSARLGDLGTQRRGRGMRTVLSRARAPVQVTQKR